jgi:regulator of sigma E protease
VNWFLIFLGFAVLIILHEAGHFFAAKATGMRVEKFFLFFGPKIWSVRRGETEYGVAAIPLGGYVKITGMNPEEEIPPEVADRAYYRQPVWKRIVVIAAGPAVNIVLAFVILFGVYLAAGQPEATQSVGRTIAGTPAAKALEAGDRIVAVDGNSYPGLGVEQRLERFREDIAAHKCEGNQVDGCAAATPVVLRIERDGAPRTVVVKPEYDGEEGRALVGFSYGLRVVDISAGTAANEAVGAVWDVTAGTFETFSRLFEKEQREKLSGIVGVSDVANQTLDESVEKSLLLLALVSLSLGLINLLPILPLDGGHIFWSLVEKVRGRPVSLRVMEKASVIGFALVMLLFVLGLSNDLGRLGDSIQTR